ncbi:hypothetical protein C8A03DRAFT_17728 [Achaetomium macrosporum]|uniref:Heterokaryon incompatibility domain-containing protein n=1 Tax=Achaetomium macrosporum TaxID=79813 RepID=A0AAN7C518_9PEZI|nr:hypothetical protein C8A03DRAFT_17728 [Achaetomium macrosporum]
MWSMQHSFGGFDRCRGCDHPRPRYNGGYASVRSSLGTMLSMARYTGCEVCSILSEGILNFLSDESCGISRDDVDQLQIDFNLAGSRRSLEVRVLNTPIRLCFFASESTPWLTETMPDLPVGREVPQTTSSEESLSWAIQQLEACKQSHKNCNSDSASPLPSRVLDVFAEGDSGVRLHESQEGETAPYIALSHCWGHKPFLRTLSGSLDAHRSAIVWARLPQTFRDAIEFSRKLGIRYLWIDSLCIIQDDEHDWRREAARMASIYQNAALVISAARSHGAYGGLYADLPAKHKIHTVKHTPGASRHRSRCPTPSDDDENNTSINEEEEEPSPTETIHLRQSLTHPYRLLSPYHAAPSTLPVFTRGWILQERFLSRRILHFGPEELSFECLESSTCQCTTPITTPGTTGGGVQVQEGAPAWYKNMLDRTARPKYYYAFTTWQDWSRSGMSETELWVCWRRLVEDYTRLRLTFEKDVFPAIAGMAQLMGKVRQGQRYVAGLWEDSLVRGDLLWHVQLPPTGNDDEEEEEGWEKTWMVRPAKWRAPSWSFASVKAPVEFMNSEEGFEPECEVVDDGKEDGPQPWNLIDLDILDGGFLKNLWADDDCESLVAAGGEQPRVYCLIVARKLPQREVICLVLARVQQDGHLPVSQEHEHLYRRIGLLEIWGAPSTYVNSVGWAWLQDLRGKGEDAMVRIV